LSKIKVYHFHNGGGGGVLAVIKNLLLFSANSNIENHVIYTINKQLTRQYNIENIEGAASQHVYYYTGSNNFYHTCHYLAKLLPDEKAVIIAHDWLELGMVSNLGLKNPLILFLHGDYDYYYDLAKKHVAAIDLFITVAGNIATQLVEFLPEKKDDILYLRVPVALANCNAKTENNGFNIIFVGRLTEAKGYNLLPVIAEKLQALNIDVNWHIVGEGVETKINMRSWTKNVKVKFYDYKSNNDVMQILTGMQLLILPSLAEGMPMVIAEAMKAGVVPIVNNIKGGVQEMVINKYTGYTIQNNAVENYTEKIIQLVNNKDQLEEMKKNGVGLANQLFNPLVNTTAIEEKIMAVAAGKKNKYPVKVYGAMDTKYNYQIYQGR
jgi:glycosyltransferase involved in cell wall biosynthesis